MGGCSSVELRLRLALLPLLGRVLILLVLSRIIITHNNRVGMGKGEIGVGWDRTRLWLVRGD